MFQSINAHLPALVVVLPLVVSFFVFFSGWWLKRAAWPMAVSALVGCLVLSLIVLKAVVESGSIHYWLGGWEPPVGIEFNVDHLSAFILVIVTTLSLFTAIYAKRTVAVETPDRVALFWSLYLLLVTGMIGIIITGDMFNLFVLLEVASLTGYALVGIGKAHATLAGFRYLIVGTIGASFYLIGTGYLYLKTGSLNMADLSAILPPFYSTRAVQTAFVFIFSGFAIKIALFPLHAWQPDAYTYAPSGVSVIIATAMAKTSAYAMIRVIFSVFTLDFIQGYLSVFDLICWLAAIAMIAGSVFAIRQNHFKRMLAYSSLANVGYIVLAIGLSPATVQGLNPAIMHILNHAVIKGCMFMAACAFSYKLGLWDIREFEGLGRRMPLTCFALLLAILAMIGMPPSAGFVTKWYLILAALEAKKYQFVAIIFLSTLLMIVYFWRLVEIIYVQVSPGDGKISVRTDEAPPSMVIPCMALGILTFAIGIAWMSGIMTPILKAVNATMGLGGA